MTEYPECEKMQKVKEKSQELGFFLEWLQNKYTLCEYQNQVTHEYKDEDGNDWDTYTPESYFPSRDSINNILANYFNIDLNKVAEEQAQILKELRSK